MQQHQQDIQWCTLSRVVGNRYAASAIFGCPGRYVLKGAPPNITQLQLLETCVQDPDISIKDASKLFTQPQTFRSEKARDNIIVIFFEDGSGLITYSRDNGTFLHTLNTPSGMARKLKQLEIPVDIPTWSTT